MDGGGEDVAMVEAILKSIMNPMRRRSQMCIKLERERYGDVVREREMRIKSRLTPIFRAWSEVKAEEEELVDRFIEKQNTKSVISEFIIY